MAIALGHGVQDLRRLGRTRPGAAASLAPAPVAWSRGDTVRALVWMGVALMARAPLVVQVEGMLDHDQATVNLMALDIAHGLRWPIFFDGQRYMGALEAYTAAVFVALLGPSPRVVALAPLLFFGLFAAGQYALWRRFADRATGHLAALVSVLAAPMMALWSIASRGGYIELLAWALPVLATYRAVTRPDRPRLTPMRQAAWGFLLGFGYFLNPLSLVIYATLALDWTLGRHGADLRRARNLAGTWVDSRWAGAVWAALGVLAILLLAVGCFVRIDGEAEYVCLLGVVPAPWAQGLGALVVVAVFGVAGWWTGAARRMYDRLCGHFWFTLGMLAALSPFLIYALRIELGGAPRDLSLPIWIRAPWAIGPNVRDGLAALGPLAGCDAHAALVSLSHQFVEITPPAWTPISRGLQRATPVALTLVGALLATVAWRDRSAWRRFWALEGTAPTPPTLLAILSLGVGFGLYLLQSSSPDGSSVRYVLPTWIALPGLLATGLRTWPRTARIGAAVLLLGLWATAQANLWVDLDRPSPLRAPAQELERRGITGIVARTPELLLTAALTQGRVGGMEYHSGWPRLRDRFADRFPAGRPVVCLVDRNFRWVPSEDLEQRLRTLARRHPGRVRRTWAAGNYDAWEADVPLAEILAP